MKIGGWNLVNFLTFQKKKTKNNVCLKYVLGPIESKKIDLKINFFFRVLWLEQRWSNFGQRKKVTNFSKNCSLRTIKYNHAAITLRIPSIEQEKSQNLKISKISKTNGSSSWNIFF